MRVECSENYVCAFCGIPAIMKNGRVVSKPCGHTNAPVAASLSAKCKGSGTVEQK